MPGGLLVPAVRLIEMRGGTEHGSKDGQHGHNPQPLIKCPGNFIIAVDQKVGFTKADQPTEEKDRARAPKDENQRTPEEAVTHASYCGGLNGAG